MSAKIKHCFKYFIPILVFFMTCLIFTGCNDEENNNIPLVEVYFDININDLVKFHKSHGKMVTVSAVHPGARFGELDIVDNKVNSFKEKPQVTQGWINGGYFVVEPRFFDLIDSDSTILEREPLETAAKMGELMAYHHHGFWRCMDTKRDRDSL